MSKYGASLIRYKRDLEEWKREIERLRPIKEALEALEVDPPLLRRETWKTSDISDAMVLRAYLKCDINRKTRNSCETAEVFLHQWCPGAPEKVVYRAMERVDGKGLIDYGVSLRTGWIDPPGYDVLRADGLPITREMEDFDLPNMPKEPTRIGKDRGASGKTKIRDMIIAPVMKNYFKGAF